MEIDLKDKLTLSIDETAKLSGIGENKLRNIAKTNPLLDWILHIDNHIRIKRPLFEKWLLEQKYL